MFPLFKTLGAQKVLPCLEGGGAQKVSDLRFSHFVPPPLPVINYQSLTRIKKHVLSISPSHVTVNVDIFAQYILSGISRMVLGE